MKKRILLAAAAILTLVSLSRIPLVSYADTVTPPTSASTEPTNPETPTNPVTPPGGNVDESVYKGTDDYT